MNKITTREWEVMVLCKYGSTNWIQIKVVKDSNPVDVAEYAVENRIQDKPYFAWWVSKVPRRQNIIISKAKSKYCSTTNKSRIRFTKAAEEALNIDKEAGNCNWNNALNNYMSTVKVAWQQVDGVTPNQAISELVN